MESCLSYSRTVAFLNPVGNLQFALGIREQPSITGPIGTTCTAAASGAIEFVGSPSSVSGAPQGKMVTAGAGWTQLTYTIGSEPVRGFTGNGILDSAAAPWYVLEHVTIAIDPADPKAGPYTVYLDDLSNAGTIFESWDAAANVANSCSASRSRLTAETSPRRRTWRHSTRIVFAVEGRPPEFQFVDTPGAGFV